MGALQLHDLGNVFGLRDHEFEEGAGVQGVGVQSLRYQRKLGRIARMRQLGTDIVLVDMDVEPGRCGDGAIGLDLERHIGQRFGKLRQSRGLQQRLSAGDDKALLRERCNPLRHIRDFQRQLIRFPVEMRAIAVRPLVAFEMPRIGRVAPYAGEVAARQTDEGNRSASARPFALNGGKNLRFAGIIRGEG